MPLETHDSTCPSSHHIKQNTVFPANPSPMPSTASSYAASTTSFDTASTLSVASSTTIAPKASSPQPSSTGKDLAAAFGALRSKYGASGSSHSFCLRERVMRSIQKSSDKKSPTVAESSHTTIATDNKAKTSPPKM
ncbi:hypothetical protein GLOTRDRAFT_117418 [Gloeophyllum trabeum ATCC 11539]|uniref:Uncharacterized protein n=1 Tax=Gloeophyllum trabeum (strain ATCC 11539 / FP-39264 / Madison 617) TaxID=670483 RepID=S7PYW0_GLOTA|nr:uncharacterized protein GLOTRDRAFT_117418 [Gloeophyllum trabeum ATCC 11539]EPQ52648.1 hypothetical protein GLOTRDRAFT_117418 [Gloeophyllum trabeum ATCC 11539]